MIKKESWAITNDQRKLISVLLINPKIMEADLSFLKSISMFTTYNTTHKNMLNLIRKFYMPYLKKEYSLKNDKSETKEEKMAIETVKRIRDKKISRMKRFGDATSWLNMGFLTKF